MRIAALLAFLTTACGSDIPAPAQRGGAGSDDAARDSRAGDQNASVAGAAAAPAEAETPHASLRERLTMFFRLDEAGDQPRMDHVGGVPLVPWQRTGWGQYEVDARGTTAVPAAVGDGQHIAGASGYHFATGSAGPMKHQGGSFNWAGWASVDAADGDEPYRDEQTLLAKWNGIPDTFAPYDHREYRIWFDPAQSRWSFEVSSDGLSGAGHSQTLTHPAEIERDRLYFVEASHDAELEMIHLRVSSQTERGALESAAFHGGVFSGDADLDVGAQNTCTDDHLEGVVDAIGHWTRVLSEAESLELWNGGAGIEL